MNTINDSMNDMSNTLLNTLNSLNNLTNFNLIDCFIRSKSDHGRACVTKKSN